MNRVDTIAHAALDAAESLADRVERDPVPALGILALTYAAVILTRAGASLWYDELFTYYIATAPSWHKFIGGLLHVDLYPPLLHLLTRGSVALFGDTPLVVRIPSFLPFFIASLCLYHAVRNRLGALYGLLAILVVWASPLFVFAYEARGYALLLMFTGIVMTSWNAAIGERRSTGALIGISLGMLGAFVSHCFSIAAMAPFFAAEFVRTLDRKKVDRGVWAALLLPLPALALYVPLLRNYSHVLTFPEYATTWTKVADFYKVMLEGLGFAIVPGVIAGIIFARSIGKGRKTAGAKLVPRHEKVLIGCLLMQPVFIHLLLLRSAGAFFPRYSIAASFGFALLVVYLAAVETAASRVAAGVAVLIAFCTFAYTALIGPLYTALAEMAQDPPRQAVSFTGISPELPFVAASGLTLLEMNKRESPLFLSRLYYLTDLDSSLHYLHSNDFQGYPVIAKWFPIRARITRYPEFVKQHPRFLVLAALSDPLEWLIPKLMDSGARLRFLGEFKTGYRYRGDQCLFEVTMPSGG